MLEGITCTKCGFEFKDDDKILMHKDKFKLGSVSVFFKQTPVSLCHINCASDEYLSMIKGKRTEKDIMMFFSQKRIYHFMTKESSYSHENSVIMKELGIEPTKE